MKNKTINIISTLKSLGHIIIRSDKYLSKAMAENTRDILFILQAKKADKKTSTNDQGLMGPRLCFVNMLMDASIAVKAATITDAQKPCIAAFFAETASVISGYTQVDAQADLFFISSIIFVSL